MIQVGTKPEHAETVLEYVQDHPGLTRFQIHQALRISLDEVGMCVRWLQQHELVSREEVWA